MLSRGRATTVVAALIAAAAMLPSGCTSEPQRNDANATSSLSTSQSAEGKRPSTSLAQLTQDGRMGPLKLGMTVAQVTKAIADSGVLGLVVETVYPSGPDEAGVLVVSRSSHAGLAGTFGQSGTLDMLIGAPDSYIDGLQGEQPLSVYQRRYGPAYGLASTSWGAQYPVVTFSSGVRLQLQDDYTPEGQAGRLILLAPSAQLFFGELS